MFLRTLKRHLLNPVVLGVFAVMLILTIVLNWPLIGGETAAHVNELGETHIGTYAPSRVLTWGRLSPLYIMTAVACAVPLACLADRRKTPEGDENKGVRYVLCRAGTVALVGAAMTVMPILIA